jgi:hypothetical protein
MDFKVIFKDSFMDCQIIISPRAIRDFEERSYAKTI